MGFAPTGYHVVNVLLHLANTLLVWHLMRRLAVPGAWLVAAVFAVHPLKVESVAWIIERKDVLSGLFYLAAALTWMRLWKSRGRYAGALVIYVAALLSKSIAVTLPAALLIWHWWKQGRITATDLLRIAPLFAVGLAIVTIDLSLYRATAPASFDYSWGERCLIASRALWFYVGKLLWPSELVAVYPHWDVRVADPLAWGCLVAAVAVVWALWHCRRQIGRGPLAGVLFFGVTISPMLGFADYGFMNFSFVAARYQYLAGIGVMAVACGAATRGMGRLSGWWQQGARVVVVAVLGVLTWQHGMVWCDNESLWRHTLANNPESKYAYNNLGNALYRQGRYEGALAMYRALVERHPNDAKAISDIGHCLYQLQRYKESEKHLRRAIEVDPQTWNAYPILSATLYQQGRYEEALEPARVAVEQRPDYLEAHINLGLILNALNRFKEAETHLRRAIALDPQDVDASRQLTELLFQMGKDAQDNGQPEAAVEYYIGVLKIDPHHVEALHRSASLRTDQQHYDEALELFQRLIDINPSDAVAHGNMGVVLFYLGRSDEALRSFDQALSLDPSLEDARANREAVLEAMKGNVE